MPGRADSWRRDPRVGALVIVAGLGIALFVGLGIAVLLAPAFVRFDVAASSAIREIRLPGLLPVARVASRVGDFWPMAALTAIVAGLLAARRKVTSAIMLVAAVLGGAGVANLLKLVFMRARPDGYALIDVPSTYSFPSGHTMTAYVFFGTLAFLALLHQRTLRRAALYAALCVAAALLVGFSRVYLGVHYLGDVIGGFLLGSAWLALVILVAARWGTGDLPPGGRPGG